ncbi:DUF3307 domain-containing protein [bacterium]|nr:DUF3307 domain-containing protein [bacterium]
MSKLGLQLFVILLTAHFIGDFLLQSDKTADKKRNFYILTKHSLIIALLSYLMCGIWEGWEILAAVFISHTAIDYIKERFLKKNALFFLLDQGLHIAILWIIAFTISSCNSFSLFWVNLIGNDLLLVFLVIAGAVASIKAGSVLIGLAVEPFLEEIENHYKKMFSEEESPHRGLKDGGNVIGQLERGLIFIFVLMGHPEGIGFLIAAKSIFRFGELKEAKFRMEAEYIIIGTLMSFGYSIIIAYATKYLLGFV